MFLHGDGPNVAPDQSSDLFDLLKFNQIEASCHTFF